MADDSELQARIDALLRPDTEAADVAETEVQLSFSPFIHAHAKRAGEVASRMFLAADTGGLEAAVDAAEEAGRTESSRGLVKRAVKTFVTHNAEARARLTLPTVEAIETRDVPAGDQPPPPATPEDPPLPPGEVDRAAIPSRTLPVEERRLDWYREDPFANFHHAHWHDVWNTEGVEEQGTELIAQPRQGELFLYMHQQMLARYDTERHIAGLGATAEFEPPYTAAIPEGYGAARYATRPAGTRLRSVILRPNTPPVGPDDLNSRHTKIDQAFTDDRLDVPPALALGQLDVNQLGAAMEPSDLFIDTDTDFDLAREAGYLNFHGLGHVLTASVVNLQPEDKWPGPMAFVETAIRDPFFYRWHRHIDNQYARLQDERGAADLDEHAADVSFRGGGAQDILLGFSDQVAGEDFDAFAERLGEDFADPDGLAADTLTTRFQVSRVTAPLPSPRPEDPEEESYWTTHLSHRPFGLFVRVEADTPQHVTVRVFLVHEELAGDRRMWIELDKFDRQLEAGVNLIGRADALSSVIKRKGVDAPGAAATANGDAWCDCGWPYTLLIPSGSSADEGTRFKLMVVLTDWESDHAGQPRTCGSMSFCGARGAYPDEREMGYPFHRPFADGVLDTLAARPNIAMRDVTIRCQNPRPPE